MENMCRPSPGRKKQKRGLIAWAMAVLLGAAFAAPGPNNPSGIKQLYQHYYHVKKLQADDNWDEAIAQCKSLISRTSTFYDIYPLLAQLSREAGQLARTSAFLQRRLQKDPNNTALYYGLGLCLRAQAKNKESAEAYKKAIDLQDQSILIYYELVAPYAGDITELLKYFKNQARTHPENAMLHYGMGIIQEYKLKKFDPALEEYRQALKIAQAKGQTLQAGWLLNHIGVYYWNRGDYASALGYHRQAVEVMQEAGDKVELSRCLSNCGLDLCYLGEPRKGLEDYRRSLEISREVGYQDEEAKTLRSIGHVHFQLGEYGPAFENFTRALSVSQRIADKAGQGICLADIAQVHWARGSFAQALAYGQSGLKRSQEAGDAYGQATALNFMGSIAWTKGQFQKALEYFLGALEVNRRIGNKANEAFLLTNIGLIHHEVGDYARALDYHHQALQIFSRTGGKTGQGGCLNNIARCYAALKEYDQAQDYMDKALAIARETGDKRAESLRLNNAAHIHMQMGDYRRAAQCLEESLKLARSMGAKEREAFAWQGRGYLCLKTTDFPAALEAFQQALFIGQELDLPAIAWESSAGLAGAYAQSGDYDLAVGYYRKSIEVIESLRAQFITAEQRSGYFQEKIQVYESLIDLLVTRHQERPREGFDRLAFEYAERARARAFLDSLEEAKVDLKETLPPALRAEEMNISAEISALQTELFKPGLSEDKRKLLLKQLEEAEGRYQDLAVRMKSQSPGYARLVYPETRSLNEVQQDLLAPGTVLLEYFLGEDSAFLFCLTAKDFFAHRLPASRGLQEKVRDYIKLLSSKNGREFTAYAAGRRIYQDLLGPVEDKILRAKRLIIVPDGALYYLPFEALVMPRRTIQNSKDGRPDRFLAEEFMISYAPSASSLMNILRRPREPAGRQDWLAFAAPVCTLRGSPAGNQSGPDVTREFFLEGGADFAPLPYSKEEVQRISRLMARSRRIVFIGKEAKEDRLKELPLHDFKVLHFATHGLLDETVSLRSAVVLTLDEDPREDGFFQVREIYGTKLNADLVVLSACHTGKGKLERGEGLSGLSRAFLHAGAQCVLASLWNVNDRATAELMAQFYAFLSQGKSKEEALRLAKRRMLHSPYAHPFFWAAFVLIGDSQAVVNLGRSKP
jgi:CHAT domain-containing protein/Tfp pilus assembly protein PilF